MNHFIKNYLLVSLKGAYGNLEVVCRRQDGNSSLPEGPLRSHSIHNSLLDASILVIPDVHIEFLGRVTVHVIKEAQLAVCGARRC